MKFFSKSLWALVIVLFAFSQFASAQKGLKLGGFALPQNTWMINQDELNLPVDQFDYKATLGMAGGVTFGYNFNFNLGFRMNLLYSLQGQTYEAKNVQEEWIRYNRRLQYVKLPLLLHVNTGSEFSKIMFSFEAGFQAGLLVAARHTDNDENYIPDLKDDPNVVGLPSTYNRYKTFDYGPVVGLGVDIKLTYNTVANIHLRADYSLGDAERKGASYLYYDAGIPEERFVYSIGRQPTNNLNAGILLGITYTLAPN